MIVKNTDGPFTVVANEAAQDADLSWKAKGLLLYLLSLPEDWNIRLSELATHATDGYDSTKKAMDELLVAGYIQRGERTRKDDGRLGDYVYLVTSVRSRMPNAEKPSVDFPSQGMPSQANPQLQKKQRTKQTKTKETIKNPLPPRGGNQTAEPLVLDSEEEEKKARRIQIGKMELPTWISRESWQDFIQHRKALRKPMTARAAELILNRLIKIAAEYGETGAQLALLDAIANGWQSPYPPKDQAFRGQGNYQTASDRSNELLDRWLKEDDNGNQEHNRSSTQDLGSEHRANNPDGPSRAVAGGLPGGSGQPVHSSAEEALTRDTGEELSDDWASLGIAAQPATEHGVFFSN